MFVIRTTDKMRPHVASAVAQGVYAAILLEQLVRGELSVQEWSKETHFISSLLARTGQELGPICMSTKLDPREKMQRFLPKFVGAHTQLLAKWKEKSSKSGVKI